MKLVRTEFFAKIDRLVELTGNDLLVDKFPPQAVHNASARLLRSGIMVSTFALLEGYLEATFENLFAVISAGQVGYADLGADLQQMIIVEGVAGLVTRTQFVPKPDRQAFVEKWLPALAAFKSTPPGYTSLGFSPKGSNVGADDVRDAFAACGLDKVWNRLKAIASSIGSTRVSLEQDFRNLAAARNTAAHNPDSNIATADLQAHLQTALVLGVACDILATACCDAFTAAKVPADITASNLGTVRSLRFLDEDTSGAWCERPAAAGKVVKRYAARAAGIGAALQRKNVGFVVVRNASQLPQSIWSN
jgi:hypothetical protein